MGLIRSDSAIKCIYCKKITFKKCDKCEDAYCSKNCLEANLLQHKPICFPLPKLVLKAEAGICIECYHFGALHCETCDEIYCSLKCQKLNWPDHRSACLPMPPLVAYLGNSEWGNNLELLEDVKYDFFKDWKGKPQELLKFHARYLVPSDGSCITILGFRSTGTVYLKWNSSKVEALLVTIAKKLNFYVNQDNLQLYEVGSDHELGLSKFDGFWRRVRVLDYNPDKTNAVVLLIETGDIRKCNLNCLYRLPMRLCVLEQCVIDAKLKSVADYRFKDYPFLIDSFKALQGVYMIKYDNDKPSIDGLQKTILFRNEDEITLNEKINDLFKCELSQVDDSKRDISDGEFTIVYMGDLKTDGYVACVRCEDYEWYKAIQSSLSNFKSGSIPYSPGIREYCLAKYENQWYRGECVNYDGDKFEIYLFDLGTRQLIDEQNIRKYNEDLNKVCKTFLICFEELSMKLSKPQLLFLEEYFGYSPVVRLKGLTPIMPPLYSARSKKLLEEMAKEGLIPSRPAYYY